jgi:hypothetical protein
MGFLELSKANLLLGRRDPLSSWFPCFDYCCVKALNESGPLHTQCTKQTLYFCYQETRGDERHEKREGEREVLERFSKEKRDSQCE